MKQLKSELSDWRAVPAELAELSSLKTDDVLQPRDPRATRRAEAGHEQRETERQIQDLTRVLSTDPSEELEALLVAKAGSALYVVDGHHRFAAYENAERRMVPVRVRAMTKRRAVQLSRLVNLDGRNLSLTRGQKYEALWQHLIDVTQGGQRTLKASGTSQRELQAGFGIGSKTTVGNMLDRIPLANELRKGNSVPKDDLDKATRWPTWRFVKFHLHPLESDGLTAEQRHDEQVLKMAAKLATWSDRHSIERVKAAFRLMLTEAREDPSEFGDPQFDNPDF